MFQNKTFIIHSYSSIEDLKESLNDYIEPKKFLHSLRSNPKKYQGKIINNSFKINRRIGYRDTSLPIIIGDFFDEKDYRTIHIIIKHNLIVNIFTLFWTVMWFLGFIFITISLIKKHNFEFIIMLPPVIIYYSYLIDKYRFNSECSIYEKDFLKIFNAFELKIV